MRKLGFVALVLSMLVPLAVGQEARRRWERTCQIRHDKFDRILPEAMRENGIDMWITMMKEGLEDPLFRDFGEGYVGGIGYFIFTDRGGDRIERAVIGIADRRLESCGLYDIVEDVVDLEKFVSERDPKRIGLNMSEGIGAADGLSYSSHG
ncbi:MAG: M24 family metallopeptidase, partial [Vicinamibacteria bacterium]